MNGVRYPAELKEEALRLYVDEKISAAAVAARLGLARYTVKDWLRVRGLMRSMSEAAALSVQCKPRGAYGKRVEWKSAKTGRIEIADSTYEAARMAQLDADPDVLDWWRCHDRIAYQIRGGASRLYVPDFSVLRQGGRWVVEEVKPAQFVDQGDNPAKSAAAYRHYSALSVEYRVVTEAEIGVADRAAYETYRPDAVQAAQRHAEKVRASRSRREALETSEERRARLDYRAANRRRSNAIQRTVESEAKAEIRRAKQRAAYARRKVEGKADQCAA